MMKNIFYILNIILCLFCTNIIIIQPIKAETAQAKIDEQKLEVAKDLTKWVQNYLSKEKALVAIVARRGSKQTRKYDKTGMGHAGLAIYSPNLKTWIIYNLINSKVGTNPKSEIKRISLVDFFYGQKDYTRNALILIPDKPTSDRIYSSFMDKKYESIFFTDNYNLLSPYNNQKSLNCNKWLLMQIVAARLNNYENINLILKTISDNFEPARIKFSVIEWHFAQKKNNLISSELNPKNIETITVESLYNSNLFEKKFFYKDNILVIPSIERVAK